MSGVWHSNSQTCSVRLSFGGTLQRYRTLNLDIIATQLVDNNVVRRRAKGTIHVRRGKCFSASQSAR